MNTLTYILQLNDKMSATLSKVGVSTNSTTREVRNLKGEVQGLNKINLGGFLSSIGKLAGALGVGVAIGKAIKTGMDQEMRDTSFEVLFGGMDNAKKMINEISDYAAKSPYGKAGLSEATQMMAGFGIAQDKIMPNLKAIGDIAMGDAQKLNSLTLAFSQMSSTGKLTGQDLLQMINAGFNPLEQMARTTGKSVEVLKQEMAKGLVTSEMVTKAFHDATAEGGKFHGMVDKMNNTAAGQWKTAMSNVSEILLNLYSKVLQPVILPILKKTNEFFTEHGQKLYDFFGSVSTVIQGVFGRIKENSGTIMTALSPLLDIVKDAFSTFKQLFGIIRTGNLGSYFQPIVEMFQTHVIPLVSKLYYTIKDMVLQVVDFISQSTMLRDFWLTIVDFAKALYSIISWVVDKLKWLFDNVVMPILKGIEKVYRFLSGSKPSKIEVISKNPVQAIAPATVPGANGSTVGGSRTNGAGMGTGNGVGNETANSIATGGTKTTHITINIAEMGNNLQVYASNVRESASQIRDLVLDELTRALSMAQGQTG